MKMTTRLLCSMVGLASAFLVSHCAFTQEQGNVADGVLPGGNLIACETYSLRELFKEQKPDPNKPWIGKYSRLDIYSYPAFMKELGIKGVAINDWYLGNINAPDFEKSLDKVVEACKASDRVIVALITGGPMALADEPKRLEGLGVLEKKLRIAKRLGAPVVRIDLGSPGEGIPDEVGIENCIDSFKRLLPLAKELGIKMTIENHGGCSRTAENILKIIKGTDPQWVGSCLDFMNWPRKPEELHILYESCEALAPFAYHTHAKCLKFKDDGEEALVDYGRILGYLKAANYKGAISIEFEGGGDPVEGVKKSRDLIIKHWK